MPTAPCVGNHSNEKIVEELLDVVVLPAISADPEIGQHRCKVLQAHLHSIIHAMVARPVGRKEIESNPEAQHSIDVEWNSLESKGAWDYIAVREWLQVVREAKSRGEKAHVRKMVEICVEKGANFNLETLSASLRVGLCFRRRTSSALNMDRPLLPWKRPKPLAPTELCLEIVPNNPTGDRHILRRCTRALRHGCASPNFAGRKVGPRSRCFSDVRTGPARGKRAGTHFIQD